MALEQCFAPSLCLGAGTARASQLGIHLTVAGLGLPGVLGQRALGGPVLGVGERTRLELMDARRQLCVGLASQQLVALVQTLAEPTLRL